VHNPWNRRAYSTGGAVSGFGIDVRDFGSTSGSNFRDTLDKAVQAAYIESGDNDGSLGCAIGVVIPSGRYSMGDTTLSYPGSYPKYTPGLIGVGGVGSVILEWTNTVQGPWISTGSEDPEEGIANASLNQVFQNLELRCEGGVSRYGGIKSRFGIMQRFTDVLVRGLSERNQRWDTGTAFDFRSSSVEGSNHQHLRLERCYSHYNQIGYWFGESTWAATLLDVHANGSTVAGALYESGAVVTWTGGNTQCGPSSVESTHWNAGTRQAVHCSGANVTAGLPSGASGSMGAASGQFVTVTGLANLLGYAIGNSSTHKGMWLEVTRNDAPYTEDDRVSGLYRIEQVLNASSCIIRKGANPQPGESITWQVRGGGGGYNLTYNGGIYHEGGAYALWSFGPDILSSSKVHITGCETSNSDVAVEATGVGGTIQIETTASGGSLSGWLHRTTSFATDQRITEISMDSYSRPGVRARVVSSGTENRPTIMWDTCPRSNRYNTALRERGFIFACDARNAGSLTLDGTDVEAWGDFLSGVAGAPLNPAVFPQYVANDSGLGTPAVRLTGAATRALCGAMTWGLTSLFDEGAAIEPTVMMIARLPNTTVSAGNRRARLLGVASDFSVNLHWNDVQFADGSATVMFYSPGSGGGVTSSLFAADTNPHIVIGTAHCGGRGSAGGASDKVAYAAAQTSYGYAPFGFVGGETATLSIGDPSNDDLIGDLIVGHIAVAPFGITDEERAYFIDLARNEFNVSE